MQGDPAHEEYPPITADDGEITRAFEQARIVPLVLSVIHLTGDATLLNEAAPGSVTIQNMDGTLGDEAKARVRARALTALAADRDGAALPPPPDAALMQRMIEFVAGTAVSPYYAEMLQDDLGLDATWRFR